MIKELYKFNKTDRAWHLPIVAGSCVGIPLLIALLVDDIEAGKLASLGALVILYIQSNKLAEPNVSLLVSPDHLMTVRFLDILVGSIIGAIGGLFLFNQRIHFYAKKQVRKSKVVIRKYK